MKALRLQVLHTCVVSRGHTPFDGSPSLSVNTTRNNGPKRPRRLVCFASTMNKLVACFASSSERQKRQRYFKAILLHTDVVYFPRIFRYICLLHTSINYTENVRIFSACANSGYQALFSDFSSAWVRGYGIAGFRRTREPDEEATHETMERRLFQ